MWLKWLSYNAWFRWFSYHVCSGDCLTVCGSGDCLTMYGSGDCLTICDSSDCLTMYGSDDCLTVFGSGDCLIMFVQMIVLPCTAPCLSHFVLFFEKIWLFFLLFLSILRFFNYLVLLCSHAMCSLVHKILFLFNFIIFIFFIEILQLSFQCSFSDNVKLGIKRKYLIFFCKHFSFYCLNLHIYKLYHIWYTF